MNFDDFDTQIQSDELEENFMEYNESMPCAPTMPVKNFIGLVVLLFTMQ